MPRSGVFLNNLFNRPPQSSTSNLPLNGSAQTSDSNVQLNRLTQKFSTTIQRAAGEPIDRYAALLLVRLVDVFDVVDWLPLALLRPSDNASAEIKLTTFMPSRSISITCLSTRLLKNK